MTHHPIYVMLYVRNILYTLQQPHSSNCVGTACHLLQSGPLKTQKAVPALLLCTAVLMQTYHYPKAEVSSLLQLSL